MTGRDIFCIEEGNYPNERVGCGREVRRRKFSVDIDLRHMRDGSERRAGVVGVAFRGRMKIDDRLKGECHKWSNIPISGIAPDPCALDTWCAD